MAPTPTGPIPWARRATSRSGPGRDQVRFTVPSSSATVVVELVYQTMPPGQRDHLARVATPAAVRFTQMAEGVSPEPLVIARVEQPL
jgi:hypothetical protein